jgi:tRNA-dihydrouridine synthase B
LASQNSSLLRSVTLAGVEIPGNLFLAPMAGYTDAAFRAVCADWGASLCFSEMVSAEGLSRGNTKTLHLLRRGEEEQLLGFQLFASDAVTMGKAVRAVNPLAPLLIDLNCGCSVPKVLKTGSGAALLRSPALIGEMVRAMKQETDIPISVKLRSGWDEQEITYMECAQKAVEAGASLLCLHPRTRAQGFSGKARWEHIRELESASRVPVFGSGDLFSAEDCLSMLESTGCHGVMIARGALGNPFIFQQTKDLLKYGREQEESAASPTDRLDTALHHLELLVRLKGERAACREMRKHFVSYTRGMEGGVALRQSVVQASTVEDYQAVVAKYFGLTR